MNAHIGVDVESSLVHTVRDPEVRWNVAMRPGKRKALDKTKTVGQLKDRKQRQSYPKRAQTDRGRKKAVFIAVESAAFGYCTTACLSCSSDRQLTRLP